MPPAPLHTVRLGGEGGQRLEVWQGLALWMQRLDADMACPRIEMGLEALPDDRRVPPGDHDVHKPVAAPVRQVLLTEPQAPPVAAVVCQGEGKSPNVAPHPPGPSRGP